MLPVENLDGEDVGLALFLVPGNGPLLLGNSLQKKAVVDGPEDLTEYTDAKGLRVVTPTYFDGVRIGLSAVTTRGDFLQQTTSDEALLLDEFYFTTVIKR
jgi:hypothetical protein